MSVNFGTFGGGGSFYSYCLTYVVNPVGKNQGIVRQGSSEGHCEKYQSYVVNPV